MQLVHHNDPAHGWVEVPITLLRDLDIVGDITSFSYLSDDGDTAYLEEDCDATTLIRALQGRAISPTWVDSYTPDCFVRHLHPYRSQRVADRLQEVTRA